MSHHQSKPVAVLSRNNPTVTFSFHCTFQTDSSSVAKLSSKMPFFAIRQNCDCSVCRWITCTFNPLQLQATALTERIGIKPAPENTARHRSHLATREHPASSPTLPRPACCRLTTHAWVWVWPLSGHTSHCSLFNHSDWIMGCLGGGDNRGCAPYYSNHETFLL